MKAAAAVLGASLLFFLGVVTGVGRREPVPPPGSIPLGVVSGAAQPDTPATPSPPTTAPRVEPTTTTRPAAVPPASTSPTSTVNPTRPSGSPDPTPTTGTTAPPAPAEPPPTTTTAGPGQVEEVENQVDCSPADKKGKKNGDPCASTTTRGGGGGGAGGGNGG